MHLLLIHQNFPGQFRDLAPAWLLWGHAVTAISEAAAPSDPERWEGLTHLQYQLDNPENCSPSDRGRAVASACEQLQASGSNPDLVLVHSGWGEAEHLRSVFPRTPLIVYPELWGSPEALGFGFDDHLAELSADPAWFAMQNKLASDAITQSDCAIVPCEQQRLSFPAPLQHKLTVIPEGLVMDKYTKHPAKGFSFAGVDFLAGQPLVTVVSRGLEPLRGLRQVLLAWPEVSEALPDAQLLLIGDRDKGYGMEAPRSCSDHLSAQLDTLGPSVDLGRIHVMGCLQHQDMIRVLQCSACHLALSYPYSLSWSTLEAMACGAPVVSNDNSPIAPELSNGLNGCLIPFNNHRALAQVTIDLLQNPGKGCELGQAGQQTMEQRFSLRVSLKAYQALFDALTDKSEPSIQRSN